MKLEARHIKVIRKCNYEDFITVDNKIGTAQQKAIAELYAKNKIIIGHWSSNGTLSIKLNKRIKNYNKKDI